jgi:hypothetical protein
LANVILEIAFFMANFDGGESIRYVSLFIFGNLVIMMNEGA